MKAKLLHALSFIALLIITLSFSACNSKPGPSEFDLYRADMRTRKSLSYTAEIKTWSSTMTDTVKNEDTVVLSKISGDTLTGGKIFVQDLYNDVYYDGKDVYWREKDSISIQKRLISENGMDNIYGRSVSNGILFDFLDTSLWIFKDTGYSSTCTLKNHMVLMALVSNDTANGSEAGITYTFKEKSSFPAMISFYKKRQGVTSHRELIFKNVQFDADIEKHGKAWFDEGYPVALVHPVSEKPVVLADGAKPGPIEGTNVKTGKPFAQAEISGKVTLVDFWFFGCSGCMEAIPSLKKLRAKYPTDKLAIVSIDPFDTGIDGINKFVTEKGINYTVVCASKSILANFQASFFPTFYILDKKGTVIFSEVGFGKDGFEEKVSKIVDSHL